MVTLVKALIILFLVGVLVAGAAGSYYFLVVLPKQHDAQEIASAPVAGQATPDPTTSDFERAKALKDQRDPEARHALEAFLTRYPDSSHRDAAESALGDLNYSELLAAQAGPGKVEYIVQRGDVLDRVAHKTKSDPELIFVANGLDRIMLQIGQKLEIPQVDFSIEIHLNAKKLVLLDHGKFFKSYPVQDARALPKKVNEIHSKVQEKLANHDGRRVIFGSRDYVNSLRSLTLAGQPAYTIYAVPDDPNEKSTGGIGVAEGDAEELHTLVSVGNPVTITTN